MAPMSRSSMLKHARHFSMDTLSELYSFANKQLYNTLDDALDGFTQQYLRQDSQNGLIEKVAQENKDVYQKHSQKLDFLRNKHSEMAQRDLQIIKQRSRLVTEPRFSNFKDYANYMIFINLLYSFERNESNPLRKINKIIDQFLRLPAPRSQTVTSSHVHDFLSIFLTLDTRTFGLQKPEVQRQFISNYTRLLEDLSHSSFQLTTKEKLRMVYLSRFLDTTNTKNFKHRNVTKVGDINTINTQMKSLPVTKENLAMSLQMIVDEKLHADRFTFSQLLSQFTTLNDTEAFEKVLDLLPNSTMTIDTYLSSSLAYNLLSIGRVSWAQLVFERVLEMSIKASKNGQPNSSACDYKIITSKVRDLDLLRRKLAHDTNLVYNVQLNHNFISHFLRYHCYATDSEFKDVFKLILLLEQNMMTKINILAQFNKLNGESMTFREIHPDYNGENILLRDDSYTGLNTLDYETLLRSFIDKNARLNENKSWNYENLNILLGLYLAQGTSSSLNHVNICRSFHQAIASVLAVGNVSRNTHVDLNNNWQLFDEIDGTDSYIKKLTTNLQISTTMANSNDINELRSSLIRFASN